MTRKNVAATRVPMPLTAAEYDDLKVMADKEGRSDAAMVKQVYLAGLRSLTRSTSRSKQK